MSGALARLAAQAEVLKLARVLGAPPERFAFLLDVPPDDIRALRHQATDVLFDSNLDALRRMAAASRLLPAAVLAVMTEKAFGPLLSARMAGLVDTARAVDIASRLSPGFLADVAAELDPRRAAGVIAGMPPASVTEVTRELQRREDWITLARFVDHVPEETALTGLAELHDAALLRVGFVLDDAGRAATVFERLPEHRYPRLVLAADEHDLWAMMFGLHLRLHEPVRLRFADAAASLEPAARARAAERGRDLGVLDDLGPLRAALLA
ncbi:hypothetical protein [Prauserella muralis]|uniref:Uncharacterized protein n=1 Tax=Prauserella muralis TaxID=588067 RepID=A0A2V4BBE6_9PSEU|nr:hypothetical protein [Prauserella muralis]PXY32590.1 hypothetical protein BAY60_10150 [Prauserella muralis]TWE23693.1 hypothetical protein FHX69_4987 [Prauserella muralis]